MSQEAHDALLLIFGGLGSQVLSIGSSVLRDGRRSRHEAAAALIAGNKQVIEEVASRVTALELRFAEVERSAVLSDEARHLLSDLREKLAGISGVVNLLGRRYFGDAWSEHESGATP